MGLFNIPWGSFAWWRRGRMWEFDEAVRLQVEAERKRREKIARDLEPFREVGAQALKSYDDWMRGKPGAKNPFDGTG